MSCGVACIGSNIQGINNIIKHKENGYLCETSIDSIKEAIITLYKDKYLKEEISNKAREFILKNNSLDSIVKKEYSLYKKLLHEMS